MNIFSLTIFLKELAKTTGANWPVYFIKTNNKCHHIELYIDISTLYLNLGDFQESLVGIVSKYLPTYC